jgi:hypothetical protein
MVDGTPQVTCEVQTENCPGNSAAGVCLRVPEIAAGDSVLLGGVNFFSTDTVVRLTSHQPIETTRDVETHVRGDLNTPVTETIDGQTSLIMDCRVNDQLLFEVPGDLPPATYSVTVIVPNITGVEFWGEVLSSDPVYIKVIYGSPDHSDALHAYRQTRHHLRRNTGQVPTVRSAAAKARRILDDDDAKRGVHGPRIMTGEAAHTTLTRQLRDRIATALQGDGVLPVWFTTTLGFQPSATKTDMWMRTATPVLTFRVIHQITDPVVALGPCPDHTDEPSRAGGYRRLAAQLDDLRHGTDATR